MKELADNRSLAEVLQRGLMEIIPFNVAVIDRAFNVVAANANFEEYFGDWRGRRCYEVYRGLDDPCPTCQAARTFEDGRARVSDESGYDRHSRPCHYVVHLAPLKGPDGRVEYVIEMSTDVTETRRWQREYDLLFERVPCLIAVIDRKFRLIRANETFRNTFGDAKGELCYEVFKRRDSPCPDCPAERTFADGRRRTSSQSGIARDGTEAHYVMTTAPLSRQAGEVQHVIEIATDVTEIKRLELEKLEAERLAAVGETVAGLAHTIKNVLTGLEGGMYMVDTGLRRGDTNRIVEGWQVLQRNFDRTTTLVRDFLSFSKGRVPELRPTDPNEVARDVVELYRDAAGRQGVELALEPTADLASAPLDPEGMQACLTNLVSNGIDAALMREEPGGRVVVRTRDENGTLVFEVEDNGCGMDYEVKHKVFTTFFTTKGGKGTGLGLLTTKKIVQEHGGRIEVDSDPGAGSAFRIRLPRARLELLSAHAKNAKANGARR